MILGVTLLLSAAATLLRGRIVAYLTPRFGTMSPRKLAGSTILLGAVLPDMKVEVDTLLADLAELVKVRSEIAAERDNLGRDLAALSQERSRMTVLVAERQRKQSEAKKALDAERAASSSPTTSSPASPS